MSKVALITGVTGQDGSYLAELLLEKVMKYTVLNVVRLHLTPNVSIIFIRILTRRTRNSTCTTAT